MPEGQFRGGPQDGGCRIDSYLRPPLGRLRQLLVPGLSRGGRTGPRDRRASRGAAGSGRSPVRHRRGRRANVNVKSVDTEVVSGTLGPFRHDHRWRYGLHTREVRIRLPQRRAGMRPTPRRRRAGGGARGASTLLAMSSADSIGGNAAALRCSKMRATRRRSRSPSRIRLVPTVSRRRLMDLTPRESDTESTRRNRRLDGRP